MKIHLQKLEKNLVFQILEQDTLPRGELITLPINNINVRICKFSYPELKISNSSLHLQDLRTSKYHGGSGGKIINSSIRKIEIKLRGDDSVGDFDVIIIPFGNNDLRDKVYKVIKESFNQLSTLIKYERFNIDL